MDLFEFIVFGTLCAYFCCSDWVCSATLSSKSLIRSSASSSLLVIPSSAFISIIVFFTSDWFLFMVSMTFFMFAISSLKFSLSSLSSVSGKLLASISFSFLQQCVTGNIPKGFVLDSPFSVTDIRKANLSSLYLSTRLASPWHSTGAEEKPGHFCFFVSREFKVERPIVPQYNAASVFFFKILNWEKQTRTFRGKCMSQEGGKLYSPSSGTLNKLLAFCSFYEEVDKPNNLCSLPSLISNNCWH